MGNSTSQKSMEIRKRNEERTEIVRISTRRSYHRLRRAKSADLFSSVFRPTVTLWQKVGLVGVLSLQGFVPNAKRTTNVIGEES